jgi:phosphoesterase RecJ-like protein
MTAIEAPEALLRLLRQGQRFVVSSHINPDGDAVGSALGLTRVLLSLGKAAVIWNRDVTPKIYRNVPGSDRILTGTSAPAGFPGNFDAAIVLECPNLSRTGLEEYLAEVPVLNIDHHLGNETYGEVNWVDTAAPALGEMIYRLAKHLGVGLDPQAATHLFVALTSDTGGFRFTNATARAFEAAADLVKDGARPNRVAEWLYESRPKSSMRLLGLMLGSLELHHEEKVASALLSREMFEQTGATPADTEGLIDYPRSIDGVQAVALIRQIEENRCKVSLRSREQVNVEEIARRHGGGGHKNAAGFVAEGTPGQVRDLVTGELGAALR